MSDQPPSRFTSQNQTTQERLSTNTVGLVALSDFRKRRAEVLEQQEREAREALLAKSAASATATPDRSQTATPNNASDSNNNSGAERQAAKNRKKKPRKALVSFGGDEDGEGSAEEAGGMERDASSKKIKAARLRDLEDDGATSSGGSDKDGKVGSKIAANATVGTAPRALTKAALRREAAEREALRKEFLVLQAAVKATEFAIPFVFYDGTNIPGGIVTVKKGEFVWVFLDKSRKVGADMGVGGDKNANVRREWARVGVDDLMLVRGSLIIPHHYEFYFFIMNKTIGPGGRRLFDYSAEAPLAADVETDSSVKSINPLSLPSKNGASARDVPDVSPLEGALDDPTYTKVVDRRWYERNKHIYPASVWQDFDPERDYQNDIRRDLGGNTFFYSKR